jgi:hypothetical protein
MNGREQMKRLDELAMDIAVANAPLRFNSPGLLKLFAVFILQNIHSIFRSLQG